MFIVIGDSLMSAGDDVGMICILTLAFVQSSLLGCWAVLGKGPYWGRIPLSFLLLIWSGYSFLGISPSPSNNEYYVSIAIMMCGQFFCIMGLIFLIQVLLKILKMDSHLDSSTRFSMGSMLIVVTLIAVAIGFGRLVVQQLGLTIAVFENPDEQFWVFPFLGIFNAMVVVLMLPALWVHRWQYKLILAIPMVFLAGITGIIEDQLFRYNFNNLPPWYIFLGLSLGQAILFYITVFPLWRWKIESEAEEPVLESDSLALEGIQE
ncbi:MAG: hypothetical protein ACKVH8_19145 [Pirellulales bacterium]